MSFKKTLLIIAHAPSPNVQRMVDAVLRGANNDDINTVEVRYLKPLDAEPEDVLNAEAIILGTTENLGYMNGLLKDFFDRIYYPCLEKTQAKPCAIFIRAGNDGSGTKRALETILTGLRWKMIQPTLICKGDFQEEFIAQCEELGLYVAASLDAGII
jgi:multimeric flavodoxin WrbA